MPQERNTGVNQLGIVTEVFAGVFVAPGVWYGDPYGLAIGGTLAVTPIAVDFVVKFREHRRQNHKDKPNNQD